MAVYIGNSSGSDQVWYDLNDEISPNEAFTVMAWVNLKSRPQTWSNFFYFGDDTGDRLWGEERSSDTSWRIGTNVSADTSTDASVLDEWWHFAMTYDPVADDGGGLIYRRSTQEEESLSDTGADGPKGSTWTYQSVGGRATPLGNESPDAWFAACKLFRGVMSDAAIARERDYYLPRPETARSCVGCWPFNVTGSNRHNALVYGSNLTPSGATSVLSDVPNPEWIDLQAPGLILHPAGATW